jgi:hypothetical protein
VGVVLGAGAVAVGFNSCALAKVAAIANKTAENPSLPKLFIIPLPTAELRNIETHTRTTGISSSTVMDAF